MEEIVYHTNYKLEDSYWWFVAREKIILHLINKLCIIGKDDFIVDYGCGTGGLTKKLSENYNVIGIDLSPIALDYCRKRGLKNLYSISLDELPSIGEYKIKAVTMFDVIEHIENDNDIVKSSYENLPNGGYLIASIPAYQWLWSHHDVIHMHYRRYKKSQIESIFRQQGFEIVYSTYFNTLLFIPAVLRRWLDKILNIKKRWHPVAPDNNEIGIVSEAVDYVPPFINNLFTKIFSFEKRILPKFKFPFGLSIFLIGKKEI